MNDDLTDYPENDNSDEDGNLYETRDGTNQESVESKKRKYKLKNRQNKQKKDYPIAEFNQVYIMSQQDYHFKGFNSNFFIINPIHSQSWFVYIPDTRN